MRLGGNLRRWMLRANQTQKLKAFWYGQAWFFRSDSANAMKMGDKVDMFTRLIVKFTYESAKANISRNDNVCWRLVLDSKLAINNPMPWCVDKFSLWRRNDKYVVWCLPFVKPRVGSWGKYYAESWQANCWKLNNKLLRIILHPACSGHIKQTTVAQTNKKTRVIRSSCFEQKPWFLWRNNANQIYGAKFASLSKLQTCVITLNKATKGRVRTPKRMKFRKSSKGGGGGGHFQSKSLCCRFWT